MVVVIRDRSSLWAVIAAMLLVLIAVSILLLIMTGGRGTVFVVAIPGFPPEAIVLGLLLGVLLITLRRRPIKAR